MDGQKIEVLFKKIFKYFLLGGLAAMFGGNLTEINSFFLHNYGFIGGTIFTTQLAIAKFVNCVFFNESAANSGQNINYF